MVSEDITERKRAEEALRESEERYRDLIDTARDVIFTISSQGVFTSFNRAFETETGWSINEWIGKPFIGLVDPNDVPIMSQRFKRVMEGQLGEPLELRIRTKYGGVVHGEFVASPQVKNGKVIGLLGIARDITERKQAEEALRESEERFKTLFEKSTEAQLLLNHEGKVVDCNMAFLDLFALQDKTEVMGHSPDEFAPKFQLDGTSSRERGEEVRRMVRERGSAQYEWAHFKHDANRTQILTELMCTLLSIAGQPMLHVAIRDITNGNKQKRHFVLKNRDLKRYQRMLHLEWS